MQNKPILPYVGITMVLSYPSRFDRNKLLTGYAGDLVVKSLGVPLEACEVRDIKCDLEWLPGTKLVILFGEQALAKYNIVDQSLHINQLRGNPWEKDNIIYIATYLPQDALDAKAQYEQNYNDNYVEYESDNDRGDEKSTKGRTARSNYRFWVTQDLKKAKRINSNPNLSSLRATTPSYRVYESIENILSVIYRDTNRIVDIDIETDYHNMMTVFSLSFNEEPIVYTIPLVRYYGEYAYNELEIAKIIRGLVHLFARCTIVTHNGSGFDLLFLARNYHIPVPRKNYDTMLVHARLFPGIEKSLGHCGSLYTWEPYHKNEANFNPHDTAQENQLWMYNAKDVWLMKLVRIAQEQEINNRRATSSIAQVNASIYPYALMTLTGVRYNKEALDYRISNNERRLVQLARVLKVMVGHDMLPTSPKACVEYFHNEMGLKVVRKTEAGNPSLDEKSLYKLYIANECPTIPVVLEYRRVAKETGMLKFNPYEPTH